MPILPPARLSLPLLLLRPLAATILLGLLLLAGTATGAENVEQQLFGAIEAGSLQQVQATLDRPAVAATEDAELSQLLDASLRHAIRHNQIEIARELLGRGAAVNQGPQPHHITPLSLAVGHKNLAMARLLLEHGADVNTRHGFWGDLTLLHIATRLGDLDMVKLLLEYHAEIRPNRWSAFWDLCKTPFDLLKNGLTLDFSREPSLLAAATDSGNLELYRWLKDKGAR